MTNPADELTKIIELARKFLQGDSDIFVFPFERKSVYVVADLLNTTQTEARKIIARGLILLTMDDFSTHRYVSEWEQIVYEFGLESYEGYDWYIKTSTFTEDGKEYLQEISFHPPDRELKVRDGRILRPKPKD